MPRPLLAIVLGLTVVGLAGCGRSDDDAAKVTTESHSDGTQTVTVTDNKGTQIAVAGPGATANMPGYAPLFPGATVLTTVTAPDKGGMVAFKTNATQEAVIAYYKKAATVAGMTDILNMSSGTTVSYSASDPKTKHGLTVVAVKGDDGTQVQVTWSNTGG